jgi:hypothetical protein
MAIIIVGVADPPHAEIVAVAERGDLAQPRQPAADLRQDRVQIGPLVLVGHEQDVGLRVPEHVRQLVLSRSGVDIDAGQYASVNGNWGMVPTSRPHTRCPAPDVTPAARGGGAVGIGAATVRSN